MRRDATTQRSWLRTAAAAAMIGGHLVAVWRRGPRMRWGATDEEVAGELPGDELIPTPSWTTTRAISVGAPCEQVWPWVAQLGQERAGFYSFERLENLVGCRVRNVDRVVDDWQHPTVGQQVHLHPKAPPLQVAVLEPGHTFVLRGAPADRDDPVADSLWGFHLRAEGPGGCRLIERNRTRHGTSLLQRLSFGTALVEPIGFVMSREMLRGIKELAETSAGRCRPWSRVPIVSRRARRRPDATGPRGAPSRTGSARRDR